MRALTYWLICMILIGILACNQDSQSSSVSTMPTVVTIEEWHKLAPSLKFDGETIERLRDDNKEFKSERAWNKFMKTVVIPEMNKATTPQQPSQVPAS